MLKTTHSASEIDDLIRLGWTSYDAGEYSAAIAAFDKVLSIVDNEVGAVQGKVASLRKLRRFADAERELQRSEENHPLTAGLQLEWGWLYHEEGRFNEAFEAFAVAVDRFPEHPDRQAWISWMVWLLRNMRRFEEAHNLVAAQLKDHPDDARLLCDEGWIWFQEREFDRAIGCFDEVLQHAPGDEESLQGKCAAYRLSGKRDLAEACIEEALARIPSSVRLLSERGWLRYDSKDYHAARADFEEAIRTEPQQTELYFSLVEVLIRLRLGCEAVLLLQKLRKERPSSLEIRRYLAQVYLRLYELQRAETEYEAILKENPRDPIATNGLGVVQFTQGRYHEALHTFEHGHSLERRNPVWFTNRARCLDRLRRIPEAIDLCREALEMEPDNPQVYACLGVIEFQRGNMLSAEGYLRESMSDDRKAGGIEDLGSLYLQMGRDQDAEMILKEAAELFDGEARASRSHLELGHLYLKGAQREQAIREYGIARSLAPSSEEPVQALSMALLDAGDHFGAEKLLREALNRHEGLHGWRLRLALSQVLTKSGDETLDRDCYEEALDEINRALRRNPQRAELHFQAGIVRAKVDDIRAAIHHFSRCRKLDPSLVEADRNLSRLRRFQRTDVVRARSGYWGLFLGFVFLVQLVAVWLLYRADRIKVEMLMTMIVTLSCLTVVAILLPWLVKLKVPGVEAELSQPSQGVSSGPKGEISLHAPPTALGSGPQ